MNIWISVPSLAIPEPIQEPGHMMEFSREPRIFLACSKYTGIVGDNCTSLTNISLGKTGEWVALATKELMKDCGEDWRPDEYIDCNASSIAGELITTDRLATRTSDSRSAACDTERSMDVVRTLLLLQEESRMAAGVVLSAMQRVSTRGNGAQKRGFPLAAGAVVLAVSVSPFSFSKSFPVLYITTSHSSKDWRIGIESVLDAIARESGVSADRITWSVAHRHSNLFLEATRQALPHATWLVRDFHPGYNFGCADPFVSLHSIFVVGSRPPMGTGVVWFNEGAGTVGAMLLNSQSVSMWNRYASEKPPYTQET